MADLQWNYAPVDIKSEFERYQDFRCQWAWSPRHEGGRYAYQYAEAADQSGIFLRFDLQTEELTELTGHGARPGAYLAARTTGSGTTSATLITQSEITNLLTAAGLLEIIAVESSDSTTAAGTPDTPTGWSKIFEETQADTATGVTTLTVFARINPGSLSSVTITGVGNHVIAARMWYANHGVSDVTTDLIVGTGNGADTGNATLNGITTTEDWTLIVQALASTRDATGPTFSAQTNANLTDLFEKVDTGTTAGAGGNIMVSDGMKNSSGATGNTTVTISVSDKWRGVQIGIPPGAGAGYDWRAFGSSAIVDDKIYIFAGEHGRPGNSVLVAGQDAETWIYDIGTDTWDTNGTTMPDFAYTGTIKVIGEDRDNSQALDHSNGKIYVFGGSGSGSSPFQNNRTDEYDPGTDTWTQLDNMVFGHDLPSMAEDGNGDFHSFGGATDTAARSNAHTVYDVGTDNWTQLDDIDDFEHADPTEVFQGGTVYVPSTDEMVFTMFDNAEPGQDFTGRYHVGTDTWASSTNEELFLDNAWSTDINLGTTVFGARYGSRYYYLTSHNGEGEGVGLIYFMFAGGRERAHWGMLMSPP